MKIGIGKLNIVSSLAEKLQKAKSMRNIIAHEYGELDNKLVFNAITQKLEDDVKEFIKEIKTEKRIR